MKIAIVGAGVSGLTAAWQLAPDHDVTVFESGNRAGGHTHTHTVNLEGNEYRVDSGFIVFNRPNYPRFCKLLDQLNIPSQVSDMSFSVSNDATGLEYSATSLSGLFARPMNAVSPRFYRMLGDIVRFYRQAPSLLGQTDLTTGEFLTRDGYSQAFAEDHLIPMASALWSAPPEQILAFPIGYMVQFFANHRMLQISNRPDWRVVQGGSSRYVDRLLERCDARLELATPIERVEGHDNGATLITRKGDCFDCDAVILACHSDQALSLLAEPSVQEQQILGAIRYQANDVVLHTDTSVLPKRRRAWAAWNARAPKDKGAPCTVSYDMNILQGLQAKEEFVVTLNRCHDIDSQRVISRMTYDHPVYCRESVAARARRNEINGLNSTWFCGAYWGWGFHEDGVSSAIDVSQAIARQTAHA